MTPQLKEWVRTMVRINILNQSHFNVLEIGSRNVNGQVRDIFEPYVKSYTGIDMVDGPGVDIVMNGNNMYGLENNFYDVVLCLETLEHDARFWYTLSEIERVIKTGGYLILSTPTYGFPYHGHPNDYYRFSKDTYREVLMPSYHYEILELTDIKDSQESPGLCALGRKI